jgi:protein-S-isoprenylcysteine O-methyltransferase Ste14
VATITNTARKQSQTNAVAEFGDEYCQYAARVPAFIPRWTSSGPAAFEDPDSGSYK